MLFIIIHQVYELWFKQILHELNGMVVFINKDQPLPFIKSLKRVTRIFDVLVHQIDILETMTPIEFDRFRSLLNPASGFQSHQFRVAEYTLGIRDKAYLRYHESNPLGFEAMKAAIEKPSLWDRVVAYMHRAGIEVPGEVLERDTHEPWVLSDKLSQALGAIYRNLDERYSLYTILESLLVGSAAAGGTDVSVVERIIGIAARGDSRGRIPEPDAEQTGFLRSGARPAHHHQARSARMSDRKLYINGAFCDDLDGSHANINPATNDDPGEFEAKAGDVDRAVRQKRRSMDLGVCLRRNGSSWRRRPTGSDGSTTSSPPRSKTPSRMWARKVDIRAALRICNSSPT